MDAQEHAQEQRTSRSPVRPGAAAIAFALLLWAASQAHAGPAKLVKDIERTSVGCETSDFVNGPDALYFGTRFDCRDGLAIWRTDGTEGGTRIVKAFARGPRSFGFVQPIATVGDQLYFGLSAGDSWGSPIVEMWRTDGTESGTALVWQATGDLRFDHQVRSTSKTEVAFHDKLIFFVDDGYVDASLWVSDGTAAGTHLIRDLGDGPHHTAEFLVRDDAVFFVASGWDGSSLWRSDGTTEGTQLVHDFGLHTLEAGVPTLAPDGRIWFTVNLAPGSNELWRTDGTAETTTRLVDLPFATTWRLIGDVHFVLEARRIGVNVRRYDPATNQIDLVKNLDPAPRGDNDLFVYGDRDGVLYFSHYAFLGSREKLWRSDGTPDGTFVLYDGLLSGYVAEGHDGFVFEPDPDPLDDRKPVWHTDGTVGGTREIRPAGSDPLSSGGVVATADTTLLVTRSWDGFDELLRTNGTPEGTVPLGRLPSPPSSQGFGVLGATAVFWSASDLWRSDGTSNGTRKLLPFGRDTADAWPHSLTDVDGTLFFDVWRRSERTNELWRSDGTKDGTRLVADFPDGADELRLLTPSRGRLLFARGPRELWSSDATRAGTRLLADVGSLADGATITGIVDVGTSAFVAIAGIDPLAGALLRVDAVAGTTSVLATVPPGMLAPFAGALYFSAPVSPTVEGLWRSDGTPAGTAPIATFHAATRRKRPFIGRLFVDADAIFFTVGRQRRLELWRSDGTGGGTGRVAELPLAPGANGRGLVFNGTFLDGVLLFSYVKDFDASSSNLWRSDGTEAGTAPVTQVGIGFELGVMTRLGDRVLLVTPTDYPPTLYFASDLWATDGTEAGTVRLIDGDVLGSTLRVVGDAAFFCARTLALDDEPRLWRTDGTPEGTVLAFDRALACTGDVETASGQLFFTASTTRHGAELWSMPLDPP